jgi:hypothetical protein
MGIFGILFVVFLVLKLTGVVTFSWWLVFLPVIIWLGILLIASIAMAGTGKIIKK